MKIIYKFIGFLIVFLPETSIGQENISVVVTSSWTAAYAELAGIDSYSVMAPFEMQHPSEYELQIEDIKRLREADLIICGGYESMMNKIRTGLQIDPERILEIKTDYNLDNITRSVHSIAKIAGTSNKAEKNLQHIRDLFIESREKIENAGLRETPVLAQFFLRSLSEELKLNIAGIFGPRQLEAFDIGELMQIDFKMIIDNAHNPSAKPLAESKKGAEIVYLINFPGVGGTRTLEDVIRYNVNMLLKNR